MLLFMIALLISPPGGSPLDSPAYQRAFPAIGIASFLRDETKDGFPPRFVLQGIPARIARIKPEMTHQQVHDVLGLDKSWLAGGIGHRGGRIFGSGHSATESFSLGREEIVTVRAMVNGVEQSVRIGQSRASIQLWFAIDILDDGEGDWWEKKSTRLTRVTYSERLKPEVDVEFQR